MSPKLKCYQNWNVTKTKWHQNWNVTKTKMSLKLKLDLTTGLSNLTLRIWHWLPWPCFIMSSQANIRITFFEQSSPRLPEVGVSRLCRQTDKQSNKHTEMLTLFSESLMGMGHLKLLNSCKGKFSVNRYDQPLDGTTDGPTDRRLDF